MRRTRQTTAIHPDPTAHARAHRSGTLRTAGISLRQRRAPALREETAKAQASLKFLAAHQCNLKGEKEETSSQMSVLTAIQWPEMLPKPKGSTRSQSLPRSPVLWDDDDDDDDDSENCSYLLSIYPGVVSRALYELTHHNSRKWDLWFLSVSPWEN